MLKHRYYVVITRLVGLRTEKMGIFIRCRPKDIEREIEKRYDYYGIDSITRL